MWQSFLTHTMLIIIVFNPKDRVSLQDILVAISTKYNNVPSPVNHAPLLLTESFQKHCYDDAASSVPQGIVAFF